MPDDGSIGLSKTCFVICPLDRPGTEARRRSDLLLKHVIRPVVEPMGYHVTRADLAPDQLTIPDSISKHIFEDDLVLADLSGCNANVFYELGKRHAWAGRCVHLTQDIRAVPFDVRHYRVIEYNLQDAAGLDDVRKELRLSVTAVEMAESKLPFVFKPEHLVGLTGITLVMNYQEDRKSHYELAQQLINDGCRKIFLMQRSSSVVLGPEQGWGGEKILYEALHRQIAAGTEFLHVVSVEGIIKHVRGTSSVFPYALDAMARLAVVGNYVGIAGPDTLWFIKKVSEESGDGDFKLDRQARTLLVERDSGLVEGLLVTDLGARQGWFHMRGPRMSDFLTRCYDFYHECSHLTTDDLSKIRLTLENLYV